MKKHVRMRNQSLQMLSRVQCQKTRQFQQHCSGCIFMTVLSGYVKFIYIFLENNAGLSSLIALIDVIYFNCIFMTVLFRCVLLGLWCLRVVVLKREQQSRKRWATQRILACIICHWQCKEGTWSLLPWRGFLCWYLGSCCKGCCFPSKI